LKSKREILVALLLSRELFIGYDFSNNT
jgi:hypothetical protein